MGFGKPPGIGKPPPPPPSLPSTDIQLAGLRAKRAAAAGGLLGGTFNVQGSPQVPMTTGTKTLLGS